MSAAVLCISGDKKGILQSSNKLTGILKVSSAHTFLKGESISGESSQTKGTVIDVVSYNSLYDVEASSIVKEGWINNSGFLNDNQQRIFDSEYYQYFSYSLQSEVQYTKWKEAVSSLNHTAGFKKFSDLIVRSESDVGISTAFFDAYNSTRYSVHYKGGGIGTVRSDNFELKNPKISIFDTIGIITFLINQTGMLVDNKAFTGQHITINGRATFVLIKKPTWKIMHYHIDKISN